MDEFRWMDFIEWIHRDGFIVMDFIGMD